MTLLESYQLDIGRQMRLAVEAERAGDAEGVLRHLEEVKRLHQLCYYDTWNQYHRSGEVK